MSLFRRFIMAAYRAITSCFGSGYWDDDKPWSDTDGWVEF